MDNMQVPMPEFPLRAKPVRSSARAANDNAAFAGALALTIPGESMVVGDTEVSDSILRAKAMARQANAAFVPKPARWQRVANALIAGVREKFGMERKD
jgi:hypothetical protein